MINMPSESNSNRSNESPDSTLTNQNISVNEYRVLQVLSTRPDEWIPESEIKAGSMSDREIASAVSWLQSKGLIHVRSTESMIYTLTDEGRRFLSQGLPEERACNLLLSSGSLKIADIMNALGEREGKIALAQLAKLGIKPLSGSVTLTNSDKLLSEIRRRKEFLLNVEKGNGDLPADLIDHFKKRENVITEKRRTLRSARISQSGISFISSVKIDTDVLGELTQDIIKGGSWKGRTFQQFDLNSRVEKILGSGIHPISYLSRMVKEIFLELGFREMGGHYMEYAAWNMDSLFIPQDHPARDMQDTFYLEASGKVEMEHPEILSILQKVHERGIRGYTGWGYRWSMERAMQLLLRTHTTVSTIRYLYENPDPPQAVFSVEKVFRHESVDWKHLAELHQIEGAYYGKDASLSSLKWLMKEFYSRLGFKDLKFIPSYYPYTEPSMDVVATINGKEMELGGSGVFRPEVTKPLGLKHPVIAWGLGLERLAMIYYGLTDIREIYQSDIEWLKSYKVRI